MASECGRQAHASRPHKLARATLLVLRHAQVVFWCVLCKVLIAILPPSQHIMIINRSRGSVAPSAARLSGVGPGSASPPHQSESTLITLQYYRSTACETARRLMLCTTLRPRTPSSEYDESARRTSPPLKRKAYHQEPASSLQYTETREEERRARRRDERSAGAAQATSARSRLSGQRRRPRTSRRPPWDHAGAISRVRPERCARRRSRRLCIPRRSRRPLGSSPGPTRHPIRGR